MHFLPNLTISNLPLLSDKPTMKVEFSYTHRLSNLPRNLPALVLLPYYFTTSANTYPRVELATTHSKAQ